MLFLRESACIVDVTRLVEEVKQPASAVALRRDELVGIVRLLQDLVLWHDVLITAHSCNIAAECVVLVGLVVDSHD